MRSVRPQRAVLLLVLFLTTGLAEQSFREFDFKALMAYRQLTDAKSKMNACNESTKVIAPGTARVIELEVRSPSLFKVNLSSTPAWQWPEGMSTWPKDPLCNGSAIIAAAFREDHVPPGFVVAKSVASQVLLQQNTSPGLGADPQLAQHFSAAIGGAPLSNSSSLQYFQRCRNYWVPAYDLLKFAGQHPSTVLKWPNGTGSLPVPHPSSCSKVSSGGQVTADCYKSTVKYNLEQNQNVAASIPPGSGKPYHKECGPSGSKVYVYVYNCYQKPGADMLVHLDLDMHKQTVVPKEDRCYTRRDEVAFFLQGLSVFFMAACAAALLLPQGIAQGWKLLKGCRKDVENDDASGPVDGSDMANPPVKTRAAEAWRLYNAMLTTMHSPSGYSRLYTITLVTTAALLIASIVWPPTVDPAAQHDHAWYDSIIAPRQSTYAENKAHVITYYLKIMGLSALIGHTVKIALLANLSPPDPSSKGICVPGKVWVVQKWVSLLGLCLLTFLMGSSLFYMLLQWRVWVVRWPYLWMMVCIMGNFCVALGSFVVHTFILPPPLDTAALPTYDSSQQSAPDVDSVQKDQAAHDASHASHQSSSWAEAVSGTHSTAQHVSTRTPAGKDANSTSAFELQASKAAFGSSKQHDAAAAAGYGQAVEPATATADPTGVRVTVQGPIVSGKKQDNARAGTEEEPGCLVCTWQWLKTRPTWFKTAVLEDENTKYSSWVLAPMWLTCYLIVFWWLMGVERSGDLLDCLSDPVYCISGGHVLDYGQPMMSGKDKMLMMKGMMDLAGTQAMGQLNTAAQPNTSSPLGAVQQAGLSATIAYVTKLANDLNYGPLNATMDNANSTANLLDYYDWYQASVEFSRTVGRWVGYSLATMMACFSLFRIVMSFKRSITVSQQWEQYWREHTEVRDVIRDAGAEENTKEARALAHVMATMQGDPRITVVWAQAITGITPTGGPVFYPDVVPLCSNGSSKDASYPAVGWEGPRQGEIQPAVSSPQSGLPPAMSSGAPPGASDEGKGLSAHMMERVQQHQEDMQKVGIGGSVALFGVLISTMWIQIRFVGFILTLGFTVIAHPMFWRVALDNGWLVAGACLVLLMAFNILVVKMYVGSTLLSNGTYIRHPGTWMTYFLMFQLGFMVIGWLYSLWRIVLAVVVMLLYSVAALDRSLLHTAQFLDGPYKTFLASVKLEGAYRKISQGLPFPKAEHRKPNKHKTEQKQQQQNNKNAVHKNDNSNNNSNNNSTATQLPGVGIRRLSNGLLGPQAQQQQQQDAEGTQHSSGPTDYPEVPVQDLPHQQQLHGAAAYGVPSAADYPQVGVMDIPPSPQVAVAPDQVQVYTQAWDE